LEKDDIVMNTTASVCMEKHHYADWETTRNERRQNETC